MRALRISARFGAFSLQGRVAFSWNGAEGAAMSKWKNESGSVLVVSALSMSILLGFVAFATDVGLLLRQRREAQSAADAAAMAAATESLNEGTPSSVTSGMWTVAYHDAVMNGLTPGTSNGTQNSSNGVTLTLLVSPNIEISGYNTAGYVQAVVSMNTPTMFMAAFGALRGKDYSNINVSSTAIASDTIKSDGCIYVQNAGSANVSTTANPAVAMNGNSLIAASSCGMTVNGNLTMGGNGTINAKFVAVSGTYSGNNAGNWDQGVPPQNDPLPKLQGAIPTPGTVAGGPCTAPTGSGMDCIYDYGCGSTTCTLSGVKLTPTNPTIYYYDKPLTIGGQVTLTNSTIYLAGNVYFDFNNNGYGLFTPPGYGSSCIGSTNPFCGIMLDAPTDGISGGTYSCASGNGNNGGNPGEMYFDFGSSATNFSGVVYAPYMQLFGQDQGANTTFAIDLVIGNMCMQSSPFQVSGYSGAQSPLTRVGLVY